MGGGYWLYNRNPVSVLSLILVAMFFGRLLWEYTLLHLFTSIVLHGSFIHGKFTASKVCLHVCWDKNCTDVALIVAEQGQWLVCVQQLMLSVQQRAVTW